MSCETCIHSSPRPGKKLIREKWEEDPRPIRKGWKATWWNPQDYKNADPYDGSDPDFLKRVDIAREEDNKALIYCDRFPDRKTVERTYHCGEFKVKYF